MENYIVTYKPARHRGVMNEDNFFQNWKTGEHFAGIRGKCANGMRCFRWDRIVSIVRG